MLRFLFNDPTREENGLYRQVIEPIQQYRNRVSSGIGRINERRIHLAMWTNSIAATLDELEQSVYCSERFAALVKHPFVDEMGEEERLNYRRHLYFFENSFVRIFSALDKLGSFLNEQYALRTEEIKERFSYFTVVRRMRERNEHADLYKELNKIKEKYRDSMNDLRLMRNHEIHGMNAELLDKNGRIRRQANNHERIEDLSENGRKLKEGFRMVCESLHAVFSYCNRHS